jgi:hypothetical protein
VTFSLCDPKNVPKNVVEENDVMSQQDDETNKVLLLTVHYFPASLLHTYFLISMTGSLGAGDLCSRFVYA